MLFFPYFFRSWAVR